MLFSALPQAQGLYNPDNESDACGVAMVFDLHGIRSHTIVADALLALENLDHRGAQGFDPLSGDGAGILLQLPVEFLNAMVDFALPEPNAEGENTFAAGNVFLPQDPTARAMAMDRIEKITADEGLICLGWREIPVDIIGSELGKDAAEVIPFMMQYFVTAPESEGSRPGGLALDRLMYPLRKRSEHMSEEVQAENSGLYFCSLSARTMVYKGMLTTKQLPLLYPDLLHTLLTSAIAIVHSRFSTNTFPSWTLAHPYKFIAHNGEINTVRGNRNSMRAREALLETDLIPGDLSRCFPINTDHASDSQSLDQVLELLVLGGRSLPHAVMMTLPEAWENDTQMDPQKRAFYQYHSSLIEPWDGPALVAFSDGQLIGAVLDRNGLRPGRWWRMRDDRIILASECGVLPVNPADVVEKGRLEPGVMFLADIKAGRVIPDAEIKAQLAGEFPYQEWLDAGLMDLNSVPDRLPPRLGEDPIVTRQISFGYTEEDLRLLLLPTAASGYEPIGSMGTDAPIAVMSQQPRLLFDYFAEMFAQVTNPPLDAIREEIITSLAHVIGPEQNLLLPTAASCRQIMLRGPVITNAEVDKIIHINASGDHPGFATKILRALFSVDQGGKGLEQALEELCNAASEAIACGYRTLLISDRFSQSDYAPIPSLLATSAVHHHLIRTKERTKVALVVESGDAREVHHIALLVGFGAAAVNPYLAIESIEKLVQEGELTGIDASRAVYNYVKGLSKGVLKVMSKMGISTLSSYIGAQAFEAVGLSHEIIDQYFTHTKNQLNGIGLAEIAEEALQRHRLAYLDNPSERVHRRLEIGGEYQFRREGELHLFTPETVFLLQHATRSGKAEIFARYCSEVDKLSREGGTLRGLFTLKEGVRPPVELDEVEPVESIMSRFNTGAMSYGSISAEAHETIAMAMNQIGGRSNSGEGGETPERLHDPMRISAVKQVASGRFGVTSEYLINATDIQIKLAQGAKPGEGGQLPGYKVYPWIARTRHSTPGVSLISPPPHHDIYSIEDLKQLIHDLKNVNPQARVHVKLVSAVGVGTVAAGVSKCYADVVLISGHDGGTGAAPLTSLKHAGTPWEIGLAETQQTLVLNGLRDRITVQCDGGLRTARDVMIAALLGAEEFGFSTAPLIVSGCIMMRVCHLDTCPVGVATQNPELRDRFNGKVEYLVNFFTFIAEEIRRYLAALGFRSIDEAVGRVELLDTAEGVAHWKNRNLDLSQIFHVPYDPAGGNRFNQRRRTRGQRHGLAHAVDQKLIELAEPALEEGLPVEIEYTVNNIHRTVGVMLGSEVTRRFGVAGLPEDTIKLKLKGSAGQSLGAFLPSGVTISLQGDANDYVAKGLSGGKIILRPDEKTTFSAEDQVIAGNTILYGATSGELYIRGKVGERFAVRNSGATAVVEGIGNHGLEYMTAGKVVVLGPTGRNLAAGMSGGVAYILGLNPADVNMALVDIVSPEPDELLWLKKTIMKHFHHTGSNVADSLLDDWPRRSALFSKILPRDYARVLEIASIAESEGLDVDEAIMEAARG